MTINEAAKKRISVLWNRDWNEYAHMTIDLIGENHHGPWCHIVDPCGNLACGNQAEATIDLLLMTAAGIDPNKDEWEEWKRPDDYDRFLTAEPVRR